MRNKVNISIDDVSPHPKSSVLVLDRCFELMNVFPDIKFTLFVPMAYTRVGEQAYEIRKYPDFCDILKRLPKSNFEIGWHGYHHGVIDKSSNDEFQDLNYSGASTVLEKMFVEAKVAGIRDIFKPILRPSAFRMSPESILACKEFGIEILALSDIPAVKEKYGGEDEKYDKVVYYDCNPPHKPLVLKSNTEIVYHACEWDRNYLGVNNVNELRDFLLKNVDDISFVFMETLDGRK